MRSLTATKVHDVAASASDVLATIADTSTWPLWLGHRVADSDTVVGADRIALTIQAGRRTARWDVQLSHASLKITTEDGTVDVIWVKPHATGSQVTWTRTVKALVKRRSGMWEELEDMLFRLNAVSLGSALSD
jgi:hypothetical protein